MDKAGTARPGGAQSLVLFDFLLHPERLDEHEQTRGCARGLGGLQGGPGEEPRLGGSPGTIRCGRLRALVAGMPLPLCVARLLLLEYTRCSVHSLENATPRGQHTAPPWGCMPARVRPTAVSVPEGGAAPSLPSLRCCGLSSAVLPGSSAADEPPGRRQCHRSQLVPLSEAQTGAPRLPGLLFCS